MEVVNIIFGIFLGAFFSGVYLLYNSRGDNILIKYLNHLLAIFVSLVGTGLIVIWSMLFMYVSGIHDFVFLNNIQRFDGNAVVTFGNSIVFILMLLVLIFMFLYPIVGYIQKNLNDK